MRRKKESSAPLCVFCGRSKGARFVMFNPRFKPFGTACEDCESTLPEGTQPDLMPRFTNTAPEFQSEIRAMSEGCGKSIAHVYALWRKYSASCEASDQSPVLGEFQQWYKTDLQPKTAVPA